MYEKIWDYRRKTAVMDSKDCSDYISDLAVSQDKKILLATRYSIFSIFLNEWLIIIFFKVVKGL